MDGIENSGVPLAPGASSGGDRGHPRFAGCADRNDVENIAMVSDLLMFIVLAGYLAAVTFSRG
jgi:hypothetical protein